MRRIIFLVLIFLLLPFHVSAQERSYHYDSIDVTIRVNRDTTIDVEEKQTYNFKGTYHQGWRQIPRRKLDIVTDVSIVDAVTGTPLTYSSKTLDKTKQSSWGKYTDYFDEDGRVIEWYYDKTDTAYTWILKYKVHGALEFGTQFDRLYWNIFTDYDVPVNSSRVTVILPTSFDTNSVGVNAYQTSGQPIASDISEDGSMITFNATGFTPKDAYTIDVSWPKGVVDRQAYWRDFFSMFWGYIASVIAFLLTIIIGFVWWLIHEKFAKGKGTVVVEYKPPKNYPPALAEVITTEGLSTKGWVATIVDLAVKGYVTIEEDDRKPSIFMRFFAFIIGVIFGSMIVGPFVFIFSLVKDYPISSNIYMLLLLLLMGIVYVTQPFLRLWKRTDYTLKQKNTDISKLMTYEKDYVSLLFTAGSTFSTYELRNGSNVEKQMFHKRLQALKQQVYDEADQTGAYEVKLSSEDTKWLIWIFTIIGGFALAWFVSFIGLPMTQAAVFTITLFVCVILLCTFIKYEARLSREGRILKEEWLGFKLYLEVAEKEYMQNLKPELFEKYLPYAILFGVEKQWAKAFESLEMHSPSWYSSSYGVHHSSSHTASSFSPGVFSSSFSSSFTSAFASSGASGSSGGGSAGGGGGGGGGGAS